MILNNCKIISPKEILEDKSILIEDGIIKKIDRLDRLNTSDKKIINCENDYLAPGFIDIHNHGNSGYDFMDGTEEAVDKIADYHFKKGVSSFLATIISSPMDEMLEISNFLSNYKNKKGKSKLIGIHLEGPHFNMDKKGAQNPDFLKKPSLSHMEKFLNIDDEKIRMISIAPELEGSLELIDKWVKAGKKVAIGHTLASYEESIKAFNKGASIATHLYNSMSGFNHRSPGAVGASLIDDRIYAEIIYDQIHIHRGALELAIKAKGVDKIILISDAMRAAGMKDGIYDLGGQDVHVKDGIARLESGNLAGSTLNLNQAFKNLISNQNITIPEAVNMVSLNPAKALDMEDEIGSIEEGKKADLIILDNKFNVKEMIIDGILYNLKD